MCLKCPAQDTAQQKERIYNIIQYWFAQCSNDILFTAGNHVIRNVYDMCEL